MEILWYSICPQKVEGSDYSYILKDFNSSVSFLLRFWSLPFQKNNTSSIYSHNGRCFQHPIVVLSGPFLPLSDASSG